MTGWVLSLYPRNWRQRYGAEVAALSEELIEAGETSRLQACLNLAAGGAAEWRRVLVSRAVLIRLAALAVTATVLAVLVHSTVRGAAARATRPYFEAHPAGWLLTAAEALWVGAELAEFCRGRWSRAWHDRQRETPPGQRAFLPLLAVAGAVATAGIYLAPPVFPVAAIEPGRAAFAAGLALAEAD